MKAMHTELRRMFAAPPFWISWMGLAAVLLLSAWGDQIGPALERGQLYGYLPGTAVLDSMASQPFQLLFPLACPLAYSASFLEEADSGFLKYALLRTSRRTYAAGKLSCVYLSGGVTGLLGLAAAWSAATVGCLPLVSSQEGPMLFPLFQRTILVFLCGGLWSVTGGALGVLWDSSLMAYGGPFVLGYLLAILQERYFDRCPFLSPRTWLSAGEDWPWNGWGAVLLLLSLTAAAGVLFLRGMNRRVNQL